MIIPFSTGAFQWIVAKGFRCKFRFFRIVMLCYASCETIHDVTKNFYQCTATHFGMINFYNER